MALPPDPILRAAVRWLERLRHSSPARCRALFTTHHQYSDITPTQYEAALTWLQTTGLINDLGSTVHASRRVFSAALVSGATSWFADADVLVREPAELPSDALRAADALGMAPSDAYGEIMASWGKVDTEQRERIGSAGELALIELLTKGTTVKVDHVAAVSDGYGYDITVHAEPLPVHIEVKSTLRRGRLSLFLSRHEYETMTRDAEWRLVTVRLSTEFTATAVATVSRGWIVTQVPRDNGPYGRWESCRLEVPPDALAPGIPALEHVITRDDSRLLSGEVIWPG